MQVRKMISCKKLQVKNRGRKPDKASRAAAKSTKGTPSSKAMSRKAFLAMSKLKPPGKQDESQVQEKETVPAATTPVKRGRGNQNSSPAKTTPKKQAKAAAATGKAAASLRTPNKDNPGPISERTPTTGKSFCVCSQHYIYLLLFVII
jgi:hypothetical protein